MIPSFLDALFGCWHRETSRVFTERVLVEGRVKAFSRVVCLDCGTEFEYSLATMQRGKKIFRGAKCPDMVTLERQLQKELPKLTNINAGREMKKEMEPAVTMRTALIRRIK